jgi:hypothetical protein
MTPRQLDATQPWTRRPTETSRAYDAFMRFCDLGQRRTLRTLCEINRLSKSTVASWQTNHDWIDRAKAYDEWLVRESALDQVEQVKDMRRRHAVVGSAAVEKGSKRIADVDVDRLTIREAVLLVDLGVRIERLARGEASEVVEVGMRGPSGQDILALLRRRPDLVGVAEELSAALRTSPTDMAVHQHAALRRVDDPEPVAALVHGESNGDGP